MASMVNIVSGATTRIVLGGSSRHLRVGAPQDPACACGQTLWPGEGTCGLARAIGVSVATERKTAFSRPCTPVEHDPPHLGALDLDGQLVGGLRSPRPGPVGRLALVVDGQVPSAGRGGRGALTSACWRGRACGSSVPRRDPWGGRACRSLGVHGLQPFRPTASLQPLRYLYGIIGTRYYAACMREPRSLTWSGRHALIAAIRRLPQRPGRVAREIGIVDVGSGSAPGRRQSGATPSPPPNPLLDNGR
jgi:hypothetical protein